MASDERRWVCLDVGETLIEETRLWQIWADELDVPRLTFMAAFGAVIARGEDHRRVFEMVRRPAWRTHLDRVQAQYGGFRQEDLYADALPALDALRALGYRLAIVANQPIERNAQLRALEVRAEVIAMSDELGLHKPDPRFFAKALELMGDPQPASVVYVGDRLDNDVTPAAAAGMRAVWLRRGPWGVIGEAAPAETALVVDSLAEFVQRVAECWPSPVSARAR